MKMISIGVPVYNEELNIEPMYNALTEQMNLMPEYNYEIIFADNCSKDSSQDILRRIAASDKHVKVIINQANFGPDRSALNMSTHYKGDAVISIPCDFQEPPELIPILVHEWEKGADVILGQKNKSLENPLKYFCRGIYYKIIDLMSDYSQIDQITGFGLFDKRVHDIIMGIQLNDPEYNIRNLIIEYGFSIKLVPYTQNRREHGKSSYNIIKYFHFAITSLCNTSLKPLHLMTAIGAISSVVCVIISIVYFVYKLTHWNTFDAGVAPVVIGLFMASGINLFCVGMLGEYIAIVLKRVTKKPLVLEKEKINFNEGDCDD